MDLAVFMVCNHTCMLSAVCWQKFRAFHTIVVYLCTGLRSTVLGTRLYSRLFHSVAVLSYGSMIVIGRVHSAATHLPTPELPTSVMLHPTRRY